MKRFSTYAALGLVLAASLSGCYGSFLMTKSVHTWNGSLNSRWAKEGTFLALSILPVYELAIVGDAVLFNSAEFWTGKNPMTPPK